MESVRLPDVSSLKFDEKEHVYSLDGKLLTGVTTVIDGTSSKANLIQWASDENNKHVRENISYAIPGEDGGFWAIKPSVIEEARTAHTRKKDKAAKGGTDIHKLVELYINLCLENGGNPIPAAVSTPRLIYPFIEWATTHNVQFIASEQRLYSKQNSFAGTCDFVALIDGKLTIGDLKTFAKMWSPDAFVQMGAYSLMWHELTGVRPQQSVVVKMCNPEDERLKKYNTKPFAVYPRYALQEDEDMFLKRLDVYRYNQNFISPKE